MFLGKWNKFALKKCFWWGVNIFEENLFMTIFYILYFFSFNLGGKNFFLTLKNSFFCGGKKFEQIRIK